MIASRNCRSSRFMCLYLSSSTGIERRLAREIAADFLGPLLSCKRNGAYRRARDMRRQGDVGKLQQRPVCRRRLDGEGVEHRAAKLTGGERVVQSVIVDQRTTGRIDEICTRLHPTERVAA